MIGSQNFLIAKTTRIEALEKYLEQLKTNDARRSSTNMLPLELKVAISKIEEQNRCIEVLENKIANLEALWEKLTPHEGQPIKLKAI